MLIISFNAAHLQIAVKSTTVDAMQVPSVRVIHRPVQPAVVVKLVTPTRAPPLRWFAQVMQWMGIVKIQMVEAYGPFCMLTLDSCQINNGGCDPNAVCSHNATNYAIQCTCKTGYANTGCVCNALCVGEWSKEITANATQSVHWFCIVFLKDKCVINNGDCGSNAVCSHDSKTFAIKCTCKTGFTNTGSGSQVVCKGRTAELNCARIRLTSIFLVRCS